MHVYSSVGNRSAILTSVYLVRIILVRSYAALSDVLFELHVSNLAQDIVCSDGRVLSLKSIYRDIAERQSTTVFIDVSSMSFLSNY